MKVSKGSNLNEIINEMFAHMKTQVENSALANSQFVFDRVLFLCQFSTVEPNLRQFLSSSPIR